ncbi:hypothetical protein MFC_01428 [Mesomycoplasma flocculare ATCC 27716]|nr:hypothetical protein MFC_01428 [Mesomycoplasma flocculare ATCC 27716]
MLFLELYYHQNKKLKDFVLNLPPDEFVLALNHFQGQQFYNYSRQKDFEFRFWIVFFGFANHLNLKKLFAARARLLDNRQVLTCFYNLYVLNTCQYYQMLRLLSPYHFACLVFRY